MNIHIWDSNISFWNFLCPTDRPAGWSDREVFRSICDDWCWSETMPDNDQLMRRSDWPAGHSQLTPGNPTGCRHYRSGGENVQNTFQTTGLRVWSGGCQVFTNPRWTKYQHWRGYNSAVTGCCIMGSEGLVRTSGNYNALIGFSIEQGAGHQPSKTLR